MSALWRTAGRSKGGIAAERDGFFLLNQIVKDWKRIYSPAARNLVNLINYCRLRRDFRVRGWENLVDFSKVSLRSAMVSLFEGKNRLNLQSTIYRQRWCGE